MAMLFALMGIDWVRGAGGSPDDKTVNGERKR